ncbi:hypothetical protein MGYG_00174 [Nannizzia gypsea CBS 118893]|uniref:Uncharacterized protein n=1 Tax=Arthroderma gypseum (strain ATCC MYA-4604 / CBS 118893) TaxID=535722 RepID=E5R3K7_ARTGP|nr:hypothetical protein MGYG_00174 [Nannizzia gypsea CBS 118893]EFQ97131.1 hypothetical protein MGYG_00174 [Nannizzia gypsea CBS 118893]
MGKKRSYTNFDMNKQPQCLSEMLLESLRDLEVKYPLIMYINDAEDHTLRDNERGIPQKSLYYVILCNSGYALDGWINRLPYNFSAVKCMNLSQPPYIRPRVGFDRASPNRLIPTRSKFMNQYSVYDSAYSICIALHHISLYQTRELRSLAGMALVNIGRVPHHAYDDLKDGFLPKNRVDNTKLMTNA